jgi:hypothetical protein
MPYSIILSSKEWYLSETNQIKTKVLFSFIFLLSVFSRKNKSNEIQITIGQHKIFQVMNHLIVMLI